MIEHAGGRNTMSRTPKARAAGTVSEPPGVPLVRLQTQSLTPAAQQAGSGPLAGTRPVPFGPDSPKST